jgi:hypothetical protein
VQKWLDWYIHSDCSRIIFPAKVKERPVGDEHPNTNAEESMGYIVQLSCKQNQQSISQLYPHLFILSSKHDAEYSVALKGYGSWYNNKKRKCSHVNDGRSPDTSCLLIKSKITGQPKG